MKKIKKNNLIPKIKLYSILILILYIIKEFSKDIQYGGDEKDKMTKKKYEELIKKKKKYIP